MEPTDRVGAGNPPFLVSLQPTPFLFRREEGVDECAVLVRRWPENSAKPLDPLSDTSGRAPNDRDTRLRNVDPFIKCPACHEDLEDALSIKPQVLLP